MLLGSLGELRVSRRACSKELSCWEGTKRGAARETFFLMRAVWKGGGREKEGGEKERANGMLKCNSTFMKYSLL